MSAFLYGVILQFKLDIRSKALLITCYVVPLLFYVVMGGIFTALMPEAKNTLIQSMTVMGVSMGAFIGLPPILAEIYGTDIKKAYRANGVPLYLGVVSVFLSAFLHLMIMSAIICVTAPFAFDAVFPGNMLPFVGKLTVYIAVSLSIGCALGLAVTNTSKLTIFSQFLFLPSIMLSGIMFSVDLLPGILQVIGKLFPAFWGYKMMAEDGFYWASAWPVLAMALVSMAICIGMFKRLRYSEK